MAYVLYGDAGSGSAAADLALAEIGVEVEVRDVPLDSASQRQADYAALNPQRKLPTLITPDGETLTESASILMTLAERHADASLLPQSGSAERAQALRWLFFIAAEIYPVIEMIDYPERFRPGGDDMPESERDAMRNHLREIWKRRWLIVEAVAQGEPWFLPGGFSLLDIYASVVSRWAQVTDWRRANLPRIEGIAGSVAARPALANVWQRHFG